MHVRRFLSRGLVPLLLLLLPLLAGSPAMAAGDSRTEVGAVLGAGLPDQDLVGPKNDNDLFAVYGFRVAHFLGERVVWFADGTYMPFETGTTFGDGDQTWVRSGVETLLGARTNWPWFVTVSGGWTDVDFDRPSPLAFDSSFVSVGLGQRRSREEAGGFRWELRGDRALGSVGANDVDMSNVQLLIGWSLGVGGPPKDTDGDGVPDRKDDCPDTPLGAIVDQRGCPKDTDGDGVFDGLDRCPDTPAGWAVDEYGCPRDSDGDGVMDPVDRCPDTPKGATVDEHGCPSDADGDGVYDGLDRCPDTPKGAVVDRDGCPKDSDGDGVLDGLDRCPGTPRGTEVDAKGCPIPKKAEPLFKEKKTLVLEGVNFEVNSAVLTPGSLAILDRVAASLRDWPEIRVLIAGHTDSTGRASYNLKLSERRARSVRDYLVAKGIAASRLQVAGYGETKPIASNDTDDGRARNRRVELTKLD